MIKQRLITVITILLSLLHPTYSQDIIKQYVQEHAQAVATIDPDSVNYTDLEGIGKAIGDARVVMLGEQDHGDAPAFLAKTRIIKYLHEQKGFDVLAFESDFFGMNYGWEQFKKEGGNIDSFLKQNIFPMWASCDACSNLFSRYIPATLNSAHPLELSGFDSQIMPKAFFAVLDAELKRLRLPITEHAEYATDIYPVISHWTNYYNDTIMAGKCSQYFAEIKRQMNEAKEKNEFWELAMGSTLTFVEGLRKGNDFWKSANARDSQMAINLKWLTEVKYAGKKIIVWAHNYHISKYAGHYPDAFLNPAQTMGAWYTADPAMNNQTYILSFTSYEGTAGWITKKPYKLPKTKPNSIESWINKDYQFAFLNFNEYNTLNQGKQERFYMAGGIRGPEHAYKLAEWSKIFDGVFYIKEMYPCKLIK